MKKFVKITRSKRSLGFGFTDEVEKIMPKRRGFKKGRDLDWKDWLIPNFDPSYELKENSSIWQTTIFLSIILIAFFVIFLRLIHLQIVEGKRFRELADGNRIQIKIIHAPRGVIYDRNGKILSENRPAFRLFDPATNKARLIQREEALELEVKNDPEFAKLEIDNVRTYPQGQVFAHVLGYVGEISSEQLKMEQFKNYKLGDRIGQSGIEAQYENLLKGRDGGEIIEVDSKGIKLRTIRRNQPIPGQNIYLSLDLDLQKKIFELIKETLNRVGSCCGAAIASDPLTGQILALVSLPSFDPNIFTKQEEGEISQVFTDATAPVLNRAIAGTYPPGSTFKIVSALAGLASGKITPQTQIEDRGIIYLGQFSFANWYFTQYGKLEGSVDLVKALKRSTDTYFYQVAQISGESMLIDWAKKLFLGKRLGIDLPSEAAGLVPDNDWKIKARGEPWYPGDTLHLSIGQGFILTTPLQVLGITSYIAALGSLYKPQLLLKQAPQILISNLIDSEKIKAVKNGLSEVPKTGGTAWPFFTFPIETAGKTGTAEYGDPKGRTHAWYTSFAPVNEPKIAMTVLIEGGGEGSSVAAPIVKETFRWYFSEDKNKLIKDVYTPATQSARTLGE